MSINLNENLDKDANNSQSYVEINSKQDIDLETPTFITKFVKISEQCHATTFPKTLNLNTLVATDSLSLNTSFNQLNTSFNPTPRVNNTAQPNTERDPEDYEMSIQETLLYATRFYKQSCPLFFEKFLQYVLPVIGFYFLSFKNCSATTAGFGLGYSLYYFCFHILIMSNGETINTLCAKSFINQRYKRLKLYYYRGIEINYIILLMAIGIYSRADLL